MPFSRTSVSGWMLALVLLFAAGPSLARDCNGNGKEDVRDVRGGISEDREVVEASRSRVSDWSRAARLVVCPTAGGLTRWG